MKKMEMKQGEIKMALLLCGEEEDILSVSLYCLYPFTPIYMLHIRIVNISNFIFVRNEHQEANNLQGG